MVHTDSAGLLNRVGSVGKAEVWFHGWHESNYGMGPQNFAAAQKK